MWQESHGELHDALSQTHSDYASVLTRPYCRPVQIFELQGAPCIENEPPHYNELLEQQNREVEIAVMQLDLGNALWQDVADRLMINADRLKG